MRLSVFAAAVGSVAAFVGFAGAANASATIDLIWAGTGTNEISNVNTSSAITLQVILTAGPGGSLGAAVSVDYSGVPGSVLQVLGYASTSGGPLPLNLGGPIDTGSRVENINSFSIPPSLGSGLSAGQSAQLGTVTFHKGNLVSGMFAILNGVFEIQSDANGPTDVVLNLTDDDITAMTTFNTAVLLDFSDPDFDFDGVVDRLDNCSEAINPAQDDTDFDDCGNLCDCDYDQDGICGILDFGQFGAAYLTNDEEKCHQDGFIPGCTVGILDFGFFGGRYLTVPGPSGTTAGTVACPL